MVEDVDEQVPAEVIVHFKTLFPSDNPLTVVVGLLELVNIAEPDITLQLPVPVVGVLAAKVVEPVVIQIVWLGPAFAMLDAGSTWMVIVLEVDEQVPAEVILHCKILFPNDKPETVVVGLLELVNIAEPDITLHEPVPIVGVFAARVVDPVVIQIVWLGPEFAMLDAGSTWIVMALEVDEQVPAEVILHCKILFPNDKPETVVLGLFELVKTALPLTTDQLPVPVVGVLAANVVEFVVIQIVCDGPALAILDVGSTCIVMVEDVDEQVPAEVIVHCKILFPKDKPEIVVVGLLEFVNTAEPDTTLHEPVPVVGVFVAKVVELVVIQIVWLGPALAILDAGSTWIVIVELVLEQVPAEVILHCKTLFPNDKPETAVVGLLEFVKTAEPDITLHEPVPVVGVFAAKVVEPVVIQIV